MPENQESEKPDTDIDEEIGLPENQESEGYDTDIDMGGIDTSESNESENIEATSPSPGLPLAGGGGSNAPSSSSSVKNVQEKSLDNMSSEELNNELNSVKGTLKNNQDTLTDLFNDEDPGIKGYKEAQDNAYETFQENLKEVDEDMASQLDVYKQNVYAKEQEVLKNEKKIASGENEVSDAKINLNNIISNRDNLLDILHELDSVDSSGLNFEKQNELTTKKGEVSNKLANAEKDVNTAQLKLEKAENDLDKLKDNQKELEEALDEANKNMSAYEDQIVEKHSELGNYRIEYDTAKNQYYSQKNSAIALVKQTINDSQIYLSKIETAITNVDNKQTEREFKFGDYGEDIIEFALQFVGKDKYEMNKILKEKGYPFDMEAWCAEFVSFCSGQVLGEENLPEWYTSLNRKYCPSIMNHGRKDKDGIDHALPDIRDAQPGDMVMLGIGGTGRDHAALFLEWCDEEHNKYRTVERCGDIVKICDRQVSWNEIGAIFRLY